MQYYPLVLSFTFLVGYFLGKTVATSHFLNEIKYIRETNKRK